MGKAIKLLILLAAAGAGILYYQRYHALSNVMTGASLDAGKPASPPNHGGIGKIGGLGSVGNPYKSNSMPSSGQ